MKSAQTSSCFWLLGIMLLIALGMGCGQSTPKTVETAEKPNPQPVVPKSSLPEPKQPSRKPSGLELPPKRPTDPQEKPRDPQPRQVPRDAPALRLPGSGLSRLPKLEASRLQASGIQVLEGQHIVLLTDVPVRLASQESLQELVTVFDAAYPLWCEKLQLEPTPWKIRAHLFHNPQRFKDLGLWRAELPDFRFGYAFPDAIWAKELGISDYYRRHLLLHEGVHACMFSRMGSCGPAWYMEGTAELLASHHWDGEHLEVGTFPNSREEVAGLGRIELVRETIEQSQTLSPEQVMNLRASGSWPLENYGWAWAFASFLAHHPSYRDRFWQLSDVVAQPTFDQHFQYKLIGDDWQQLSLDWQLFLQHLCYAYNFENTGLDYATGKPLPATGATCRVSAKVLWQNSGFQVEAGKRYRIDAQGRFIVASNRQTEPPHWFSEANGISFQYEQGRPLGVLLCCVISAETKQTSPLQIGLGSTIQPKRDGTLFLRINDSAGELEENAGELTVRIQLQP